MIIDLIGVDLALPVCHIVVVDQAGISPVGRVMVTMIETMVVGDSIKSQGLAIRHPQCRPLMIIDRRRLALIG